MDRFYDSVSTDFFRSSSLLILLLLAFAALRAIYQAFATPLRDVPGPWLAKFTRIWLLKAIYARSFQKENISLHRKFGPIVRIAPNEYSIDDPQAAKVIYRSKDQLEKSPRYSAWGLPGQEPNVFTLLDIQHHAERRRQIAMWFQMSSLTQLEQQIDSNTIALCNILSGFAHLSQVIEISDWLHFYAFDVLGALALGKVFGFLENGTDISGLQATIHNYSRYGANVGVYSEWHSILFQLLQIISPLGAQGMGYIAQFTRQTLDKIAERDSSKDGKDCLSVLFARHQKDPNGSKLEDIFYHTLPNVAAGAETTGISLSAAVYFLCKHPTVLNKLRHELDARRKNGQISNPITFAEAQQCPYLQSVLKETLRAHPGVGLGLPRIIPKGGITLAGRFFPEKTVVNVNAWVAHANREVFGEDADDFRPERWLQDPASSNRMEQYILTFGRGPRECLGKNVSVMEMNKLIPELVHRFDMELVNPSQEWTVYNDWFVLQKHFPVRMRLRTTGSDVLPL